MRPRGAGRDDHAIESLLADRAGDLLGRIRGADEEAFFGVDHIVQGQGIIDQGTNIDDASDIGATVTRKDTDPVCTHVQAAGK